MKAKLDGIYSPDLPSGYGEMPNDPTDFWIIIHADIGAEDDQGSDCFTLHVTSPKFLEKTLKGEHYQLGRGLIILNEFDWLIIERAVRSICHEVEADSWVEVAAKLSRNFFYEYEEYQEYE